MKKTYNGPTLVRLGRLEELTLGVGGASPDILGSNCLTGTFVSGGTTVTFGCTSTTTGPQHS